MNKKQKAVVITATVIVLAMCIGTMYEAVYAKGRITESEEQIRSMVRMVVLALRVFIVAKLATAGVLMFNPGFWQPPMTDPRMTEKEVRDAEAQG